MKWLIGNDVDTEHHLLFIFYGLHPYCSFPIFPLFHFSPHSSSLWLPFSQLNSESCSDLGEELSLTFALFLFGCPPWSFKCSWFCIALMKIPFAMFCAEDRSLHPFPLTWEQLCKHRLYTKTTCRWLWRPPEGTVRTPKWVFVSGEWMPKEQKGNAELLHSARTQATTQVTQNTAGLI